ncbi:protein-glutamate methylesterase/protein-glutamine glutaminase [Paludibacterium paludis]|uniref:Protein-glutamate methylesterase/protein-glutamine glutaminase n=1 Tax=Paludibacterium paludis TaxID=1225769 RepID=A0A918U8J9_9NEIS|nr:chemotaxis response regulator protein-glutamate methylesterase [Paludibacterium paludis]GGY10379.1 chemotaxis response regulator protein-glutamate methylesterase 1 [Paludibacterium paludis]
MTSTARKIRVVVVDDSALIRSLLTSLLNSAPDIEVVATASDPIVARERIRETSPDVVTLDVEMPRMDGLEFLRRLMRLRPTPVVMISSLTGRGSETSLAALELGAVDVIAKPVSDVARNMERYAEQIRDKIRAAAGARVFHPQRFLSHGPLSAPSSAAHGKFDALAIVFVGASTGGTEAIKAFLTQLPADFPPVLMVQHMPENFTLSFARRLDSLCAMNVKEAEDGDRIEKGWAYLAPGHSHMRIRRGGGGYVVALDKSDPVNRHRPAVDVLFRSAAVEVGRHAVGVIMTGMGKDGAEGMREMKQAGAWNIAQDEASSVVYGMPREALRAGGVDEVLPLNALPLRVIERLQGRG